jgi:hypothetical protein
MKKFWDNNSLSIVLATIFVLTISGMSVAGWATANQDLSDHNQPSQSYVEYLGSGDFIEGVFENWESEFLQMFALVVLTIWLRQKGADDSKPLRGKIPQDTTSRYSIIRAATAKQKVRALKHQLYSHSLSIALASIFLLSFVLHAVGGSMAYSEEAKFHGGEAVNALQYMGTSQFWYESLQNWQSEFLAVVTLLLLSIKLRERGSPESKPVGKSYDKTTG